MTGPSKIVSDEVLKKISDAVNAIEADASLPRTKEEIKRLTGLGHATVYRAFAQDAAAQAEQQSRWRIAERFQALTQSTGRRSQLQAVAADLTRDLKTKGTEVREAEAERDLYAQALYAYWVSSQKNGDTPQVRSIRPSRTR